jgi:hypothetical protein
MELDLDSYKQFHKTHFHPLDLKIDIPLFEKQMEQYSLAFREWGGPRKNIGRYGLPLLNQNGSLHNNPEPACYPLDIWNKENPDNKLWYPLMAEPTEVLNLSCFDPIEDIKEYMLRSCVLKWNTGANFVPHTDQTTPTEVIRLWGTNDPDNMSLRFDKSGKYVHPFDVSNTDHDLIPVENVEAGRLYLIDTCMIHDATASSDNVYQFFIALNIESLVTVASLKM